MPSEVREVRLRSHSFSTQGAGRTRSGNSDRPGEAVEFDDPQSKNTPRLTLVRPPTTDVDHCRQPLQSLSEVLAEAGSPLVFPAESPHRNDPVGGLPLIAFARVSFDAYLRLRGHYLDALQSVDDCTKQSRVVLPQLLSAIAKSEPANWFPLQKRRVVASNGRDDPQILAWHDEVIYLGKQIKASTDRAEEFRLRMEAISSGHSGWDQVVSSFLEEECGPPHDAYQLCRDLLKALKLPGGEKQVDPARVMGILAELRATERERNDMLAALHYEYANQRATLLTYELECMREKIVEWALDTAARAHAFIT